MSVVAITPLPIQITSNNVYVNNIYGETSFKNGQYYISSSSFSGKAKNAGRNRGKKYTSGNSFNADNRHDAYNAFDENPNTYWECANLGNDPGFGYTQNPYTNSRPSTYVGGGSNYNKYKTNVQGSTIYGEWIQIRLPYSVFLGSYGILTRRDSKQYPRKFYILGSNDCRHWHVLDTQNLSSMPFDLTKPTHYNLLSTEKYSCFRFVVSELFEGSQLYLSQLNLLGQINYQYDKNIDIYSNYIAGTVEKMSNMNTPYAPFSKYETFEDRGYVSSDVLKSKYQGQIDHLNYIIKTAENEIAYDASNVTDVTKQQAKTAQEAVNNAIAEKQKIYSSYINDIQQNQIVPLQKVSSDYSTLLKQLDSTYRDLSNNIAPLTDLRKKMGDTALYDYSGNSISILNTKTLSDAVQSDTYTMLIQQNNLNILACITAAVLIVGAIAILRD